MIFAGWLALYIMFAIQEQMSLPKFLIGSDRRQRMTLIEALKEDHQHMEDAAIRTAQRTDIWQDRIVYWMAVAIMHILTWILRRENNDKRNG